ncbi:MAG TPA: hypothetical protein VNC40_04625 [Gaiellaceae bacterium]|nr:hypothetical protein [Gaiellaceae bacterium]
MPKKKVSASKKRSRPEHWKDEPDEHDFPAAADYLTLVVSEPAAAVLVDGLKRAEKVARQAKDLLRASRLTLLPRNNAHVAADLKKVSGGERLSPVLLVRGQAEKGLPLLVADGYHRICASYHLDEDADIPCRMVELP